MPKTRVAARTDDQPATPLEAARAAADAMYRSACESCHQHDRVARVIARSSNDDEVQAAQKLCAECTQALRARAQEYEKAASSLHPAASDEAWWHLANALWLASREYLRRNRCCDAANREFRTHDRERLGALHAEYELEGSAVLALRTAAEAYKERRPDAL